MGEKLAKKTVDHSLGSRSLCVIIRKRSNSMIFISLSVIKYTNANSMRMRIRQGANLMGITITNLTPETIRRYVYSVLCDLMRMRSKVYSLRRCAYFLEIAKIAKQILQRPV